MLTKEERINRKKILSKKYRELNKEEIKRKKKEYYDKNREYIVNKKRKYNLENKQILKEKCKIYYKNNKEKIIKQVRDRIRNDSRAAAIAQTGSAKYRARKRNAVPIWLTKAQNKEIIDIYKKCKDLTRSTGTLYSVDHIIPLKHNLVCGLHVPWNLQIITASENSTKKNKLLL